MPYLICEPQGTVYSLKPGENTLGREADNDIPIHWDATLSVSRYHATIVVSEASTIVRDQNSRNHTFVNEVRRAKHVLQPGDRLRLGNVVFRYVSDMSDPAAQLPQSGLSVVQRLTLGPNRSGLSQLLEPKALQASMLRLQQDNPTPQKKSEQPVVDKLRILLEVGRQLSAPTGLDNLLDRVLDLLFEIMMVDRAGILLVNPETGGLEQKAFKSRSPHSSPETSFSSQIAQHVFDQGEALLLEDAGADDRFQPDQSILFQGIRASMCVPLQTGQATIGVLYVDNKTRTNLYADEDLDFLSAIATQAAIAIYNHQLSNRIQSEAVRLARLERFFPRSVSQMLEQQADLPIIETEVTALFSDITGFTQISAQMDPRAVLEQLNEYFAVMVEDIVFHYEGTLEKYIADALLAVWGAPQRRPDDAERAVTAAIAMQWAMQDLRNRSELPWQIHIGLNSGPVAAGNIGSRKLIQYATIGDTMNVASRICSTATAGEILISHATLAQLGSQAPPIEMLPERTALKGKAEPIQLYRVLWQQVTPPPRG